MRFLLILTIIISGFTGLSQPVMYSLMKAEKGDHFRNIVISRDNNLFVTQSLKEMGEIHLINDYDSILHIRRFNVKGRTYIDQKGNLGVYVGETKKFWIFNQNDLSLIDSVFIPSLMGELKIFFTAKGILIGGVNSTFLYHDKILKEIKELKSYKIFDFNYQTEDLLLGYWDINLNSDAKIRKLSHSNLKTPNEKNFLFSTDMYTLYAYFMDNAIKIVAVDGAHKVYRFDYLERTSKIIVDDKGLFSAMKVSENLMAVVTQYRGTNEISDMRWGCSISLVDVSTGKISNTYSIGKRPSTGDLVMNQLNGILYFLSSGGGSNDVIVIRK